MFGLRAVCLGAVALAASVVIFPSSAYAVMDGQTMPVGSASHVRSQNEVMLSPIVVNGQRIPMVIALTYLKTMLKRPWSTSAADLDKIVCRVEPAMGSHLDTMRCETNRRHLKVFENTQVSFLNIRSLGDGVRYGTLYVEIANWMDNHVVNRGALHEILSKLPPPGSSYTLQVTDHGKVVTKYVIEKGKLVKVIRMDRD